MVGQDQEDWLHFFREHADFGPAHEDVEEILKEEFEDETGIKVQEDW